MPPTQTQTQTLEPLPLVPESIRLQRRAIAFDAGTLMRITRMAFGHPLRMTLAIVATFLAAISQIIIPQLIGDAVDHAHGLLASGSSNSEAADALFYTAMVLLAASVFRGACTMLQNYQGEAVGHAIAYEMKLAFYKKLQHQSFSYHDHVHTGDLMSRGILDIEGTRLWVHTGILRTILLAVLIVGGAGVLMSIDFFLSLVALSFVPVVGFSASFIRLKLRVLWLRLQEELGVLTRVMEENLGGIRVVRAFASQIFELARFDVISNRALAIMHRRIFIFVMGTTTMTFMFFLAMGLVLWVGGEKVLSGDITIGEFAAFLAFMAILQMPVRQIAWTVNSIARASTCGARLFEILDREPEIRDRDGAQAIEVSNGVVRFENVSFSYTRLDGDLPVLHNISFEAHRGKIVGIVGPPGSGKSTIAHLLPALLRCERRTHHHRRKRHPRRHPGVIARQCQCGAARPFSFYRRHCQQRRLRRPMGGSKRHSARHRVGPAAQLRVASAGRLRDIGGRTRGIAFRGSTPTAGHCAKCFTHLPGHCLRRFHRLGRCRYRSIDPRGAGRHHRPSGHHHHCSPSVFADARR